MAVPSGSSRLTQAERTELDAWSFIKSYRKYHMELFYLARGIYKILFVFLNKQPPTEDEFCWFYGEVLKVTNLYVKRIARKKYYLPVSLYEYFAELLAKHVVEQDWGAISAPLP